MNKRYLINRIMMIGIFFLLVISTTATQNQVNVTETYYSTNNKFYLTTNDGAGNGNTLYVGGTGPGNYTKIQTAIDNADERDTIFVYNDSSPYYENIIVDKSITLIGENKNNTIIDGKEEGNVISIFADLVNISGFKIQNSIKETWDDAGVYIDSNHTTIQGNIIINNYQGIYLQKHVTHNTISDNMIVNNFVDGIYISKESNNNTFDKNVIQNNSEDGLECFWGEFHDNEITENVFSNNIRYGIGLRGLCENNTISENTFIGNRFEFFGGPTKNKILKNNFNQCYDIIISKSPNNLIINNNLTNCSLTIDTIRTTVLNNTFSERGIFINGYYYSTYWSTHTIENNTINGKPIRYYKNSQDIVVPDDTGQVILANCHNFTIKNHTYDGVDVGILLGFSSDNIISSNAVDSIVLLQSSNNTLTKNIITNNSYGSWEDGIILRTSSHSNLISKNVINIQGFIELFESSFNTISENILSKGGKISIYGSAEKNLIDNNSIINAAGEGIYLRGISDTTISGNNVSYSYQGINLQDSNNCIVSHNLLKNNEYGLYISGSSSNLITENTVENSTYRGIHLRGLSNSNYIYHNNFINNTKQAYDYNTNYWDNGYPSGGNYWSDYNGSDNGGDGIGDIPYNINGGINKDRYPLMDPYGTAIIIDDSDPQFVVFSGTWSLAKHSNAFNNKMRFSLAGNGTNRAGWLINSIIDPGRYSVYVWKFEHENMNLMATNTPYQIYHKNGLTRWVIVNQSAPGNEWIYIGNFEFDNSSIQGILIRDYANGFVIADAIKLVYIAPLT